MFLPPSELGRELYEKVNDVIVRLGGKWKGGRLRGHVFKDYDPAPLLAATLASGEMPPKNPTAFFPTPEPVIRTLLDACSSLNTIPCNARVLEPSAGTGAIAAALMRESEAKDELLRPLGLPVAWQIDCCEILPVNRAVLRAAGFNLVGEDFLSYQPGPVYDAVIMNPPFSLDGDKLAYITHILHAWSLLKPGGILGAIVPRGWQFRQDRRCQDFLDLVCDYGHWCDVEGGAFAESGTMVATSVVALQKDNIAWRSEPRNGHASWHEWEFSLWADNDADFHRDMKTIATNPRPDQRKALHSDACQQFADSLRRKEGVPVRLSDKDLESLWQSFIVDWDIVDDAAVEADRQLGELFDMAA